MSTTVYSIFAKQSPFDIGTDVNNRVVYSVNYDFAVASLATLANDVISYLQSNGAGTSGTDLLIGSKAIFPNPENVDPVSLLILTGGFGPDSSNDKGTTIYKGSFQITSRAIDSAVAESKAIEISGILHQVTNTTIP